MELDASKSGARGFYDNSSWNVLDHPPPIDKSAQKKKKKRLLDLTGGFRKNITTSPETEAAEIDDNSGVANVNELAVKGGIDIKTQSKKDIKGGKYEAVGKMGEEEEEEEEQDDESLEIEGEDAEDKR